MRTAQAPGRDQRVHAACAVASTVEKQESTIAQRVKRRRRGPERKTCQVMKPVLSAKNGSCVSSESKESETRHAPDQKTTRRICSLTPPNFKGVLRVSRSENVFDKHHILEGPLGNQAHYGGGCLVYRSKWQNHSTVTKLMPLFKTKNFSAPEMDDMSRREAKIHEDAYRLGLSKHPNQCPVAPVWAVTNTSFGSKRYLAVVTPRFDCDLTDVRAFSREHGRVAPDAAWRVLRAGVDFVRICIECKFVHHDIKTDNIFLTLNKPGDAIRDVCFGDYGCSAWTKKEFPYHAISGTLTMWDMESLGSRHGEEDGFCIENDLFGVLGCFLVVVSGAWLLEDKLDQVHPNWEKLPFDARTDLIRRWRKRLFTRDNLNQIVEESLCGEDEDLKEIILQLAVSRSDRMNLEQIEQLVKLHEKNVEK